MSLLLPGRRRARLTAVSLLAATMTAATFVPSAWAGPQPAGTAPPVYRDTHYSFAERAADLVSRMTLPEKVLQLHTNSAPAIPRLGVQQYTYWSEGQHGLNTLGANTNAGTVTGGVHATSFPTNLASTMSWDPELIYQETTAISDEARGMLDKSLWGVAQNNIGPDKNGYGSLTYWAPTVNLDRDPRWGRTDEGFGEDPYLVAKMAGAFVNGYQGQTREGRPMTPYLKVAATAKHYALNDVENDRHADSSDTTDANIRDYYTRQFRDLIQDAHVSGLMTSYNAINGTPAPANTYTANELAQRTYGFDRYTTSDCGAVGDVYAPGSHNWAPPGWTTTTANAATQWTNTATGQQVSGAAGGQAYALRAGTQLNCTGSEDTLANIQEAIKAGVLSEGVVDDALVHLFTMRMQTGEFDPADRVGYTKITKDQIQSAAHQALATKVADNSLVLLKNEKVSGTPLLPADPAKLGNVVVVGDLAGKVTLGDYSGEPALQVNAVQGITSALKAANPAATITFDACGTSTGTTTAASCSAATMAAVKTADLVVVFAGTDTNVATEGRDRTSIAMPGNYDSLLDQVAAAGNPRTALAVQAGGAVSLDHAKSGYPAIVFSAYNGESQGTALADVLFGKQNPSGHLNFTWYADDTQLPDMKNYGLTPSQTSGLGRTYQYFTGTPAYPFGYGLSYTDFAYSHVHADTRTARADGKVTIDLDVTNTGSTPGATVAQLYAATAFTVPGVELPRQRLAGFKKTGVLAPGQTQHLTIPVRLSDLSLWDEAKHRQVVYEGSYRFGVGADAAHLAGTATVAVTGAITPRTQYVTVQPGQVVFAPGQSIDLAGKNPWIADDTAQAAQHVPADHVVEAVNTDQSFADLAHKRVVYRSSDPRVAQVSRTGKVSLIAPGVATISVTVDGVTGSTPVVVKQPFTLSAPDRVQAGTTYTVTTTLPNPAGARPLRDVTLALSVPTGWTAQATSPATFATVAAGQTVSTTWQVGVPAAAQPGKFDVSAEAAFTSVNGPGTSVDATTVILPHPPYPSLPAAYNNVGVSDDATPGAGNFDGGNASFSAQALAAATPSLTPGATFTHDGLTFTWPDVTPGSPDNVVAGGVAGGQTILVSGTGHTLGLIGAGDYGSPTGTATVTYTDGTSESHSVSFADWWANAATGGDVLTTLPYLNNSSGRLNQQVSLYYAPIPLRAGKTVQSVTLPDVSDGANTGTAAMHIFAIAIG
ncbi:glycoside hydrolase family 3 C-terminal domain-containing protein [Amycolatopsis sp. SID8362]|uniref:glycoside hydrolase family 3 C-terminal domain-containing protein n=1 Tax=Amycolatopsis sp. SID8362 TaxID=2690346 RepID=UPI00136DA61E|nr:glycoside hydrolase family 3 C-terminal domain-containing protein [Amycolatopsis sp. SID8362]NBH06535.1 beta-glucosidase [Amycolatopsis sp. SID8362]NED43232.1 beta-glucosidase [Amycolatopsis sp. SID8362]